MDLSELQTKINWSNFYICKDCTFSSTHDVFELMPDDFLIFAKEDYKNLDNRGLIGVVSNSKRAIDCQVDWIISYFGFDYLNFCESKYPYVKLLIDEFESDANCNKDSSFKLRFIQALEIAPTFLISKIRTFRNKLEHEYIMPTEEEAREAIEISELFINATQNVVSNKIFSDYAVQNYYDENKSKFSLPFIKISFDSNVNQESKIDIYYKIDDSDKGEITLKSDSKEYVFLLKAAISHKFNYVALVFKPNINLKYIKYEIKEC